MTDLTPDRLLTPEEVAEFLQIPLGSLYQQRYRGVKPGSLGIRIGRHIRFAPGVLDDWIEAQSSRTQRALPTTTRTVTLNVTVRYAAPIFDDDGEVADELFAELESLDVRRTRIIDGLDLTVVGITLPTEEGGDGWDTLRVVLREEPT